MKIVIRAKLKLTTTTEQFQALRATQLAYRDALNRVCCICSWSGVGWLAQSPWTTMHGLNPCVSQDTCAGITVLTLSWFAKNAPSSCCYCNRDECHLTHPLASGRSARTDSYISIQQEADKERTQFCVSIESLSTDDLRVIEPLPSRHELGSREQERIWQRLRRHWGLTPQLHWYPLNNVVPPHVLAFQEDWFARSIPPDVLRQILMQRRVRRVWELREGGMPHQYEMDVTLLVPWDGGGEHCWTSQKMDWLIYTSHESSITIGGEWLLNLVKQAWPQWEEYLYTLSTGARYQRPPLTPL